MLSRIYHGFVFFEKKVVGNIAKVILAAGSAIVIVEVFRRYLFGLSFMWSQEIVVYFISAAAFMMFGLAMRNNAHLRVTLLTGRLSDRLRMSLEIVAYVISLAYCGILAWTTIDVIGLFYERNVVSLNARIPIWPFYACLLVGTIFFIIALIDKLVVTIRQLRGKERYG